MTPRLLWPKPRTENPGDGDDIEGQDNDVPITDDQADAIHADRIEDHAEDARW